METLDAIVTYTLDLVLAGSAFYLGASMTLYLAKRWKKLEPKSKVKAPQAVNIPLQLKASVAEAIPLEAELQEVRSMEAMPAMPSMPSTPSIPDRPLKSSSPTATELQLTAKPEAIEPTALPELKLAEKPEVEEVEAIEAPIGSEEPASAPAHEAPVALPELHLSPSTTATTPSVSEASEPPVIEESSEETSCPEPFAQVPEPLFAEEEDVSSEPTSAETERSGEAGPEDPA